MTSKVLDLMNFEQIWDFVGQYNGGSEEIVEGNFEWYVEGNVEANCERTV